MSVRLLFVFVFVLFCFFSESAQNINLGFVEDDVTKLTPNFAFSSMRYLTAVSKRRCYRDLKTERIEICLSTRKI